MAIVSIFVFPDVEGNAQARGKEKNADFTFSLIVFSFSSLKLGGKYTLVYVLSNVLADRSLNSKQLTRTGISCAVILILQIHLQSSVHTF